MLKQRSLKHLGTFDAVFTPEDEDKITYHLYVYCGLSLSDVPIDVVSYVVGKEVLVTTNATNAKRFHSNCLGVIKNTVNLEYLQNGFYKTNKPTLVHFEFLLEE